MLLYLMKKTGQCHNPYFNRWFSAIELKYNIETHEYGHNPYFNRWFSAIMLELDIVHLDEQSQSLF